MEQNQKPLILLRGTSGDYDGIEFFINKDEYVIGRSPQCDLVLTETTVSAQHAKIFKNDGQWMIADLNSTNGLFLNNARVTEKKLRTGDKITIESITFKFINRLDVERTVVSTEQSPQIAPEPPTPPSAAAQTAQMDQSPYATNKEVKIEENEAKSTAAPPAIERSTTAKGLILGVLFSGIINIGIPFITSVIQSIQITSKNLSTLFSTIIAALPIWHLPSHWIKIKNWNIFTIVVLLCIPLGVIGGSFVCQRVNGRSRLRNTLSFSLLYAGSALLLQFIFAKFNFNLWINQLNATGLGINNVTIHFMVAILFFWFMVSLFSFLGTLLARH